jgi:hypothetical protein
VWFFSEALLDQPLKTPRNLTIDAARSDKLVFQDLGSDRTGIVIAKGLDAGEHLVQYNAEGKNVRPDIELLAEDLLG